MYELIHPNDLSNGGLESVISDSDYLSLPYYKRIKYKKNLSQDSSDTNSNLNNQSSLVEPFLGSIDHEVSRGYQNEQGTSQANDYGGGSFGGGGGGSQESWPDHSSSSSSDSSSYDSGSSSSDGGGGSSD